MKPAKVLFVCVENSCRSQMAEGFARALGPGALEPWSAGSRPSGTVNPRAIEFMREKGVELGKSASKSLADVPQSGWDFVVTMGCGEACPFVAAKKKEDWALPDPKNLPPEEFREVRDAIEAKVRALIESVRQGAF